MSCQACSRLLERNGPAAVSTAAATALRSFAVEIVLPNGCT